MINVAFCSDGIFPRAVGGIQRHSRLLIEGLANYDDLNLTIFHPHEESLFSNYPNIAEIRVPEIDKDKIYLFELYRYSKHIARHLKELKPDVIYSQGFSVWNSIDSLGKRVIVNPHGLEPFQGITLKDRMIGFPFRKVLSRLFKKSRYTVSLGGKLTSIIAQIIEREKIAVIPNAVQVSDAAMGTKTTRVFNPEEPIKILFVGRFAANKGIHLLMQTITDLNQQGYKEKIEYYLAGKGPLYEEYKSKYQFENVQFLGFVSDEQLENLYETSDLFVLPTLFEGMPTVVLEAMVHQLPVVVSDVGATAEQVNEENGYLIEKNNVPLLTNAIRDFYDRPVEEKRAMAQQSYQKVTNQFSWDKVAEQHHTLFHSLYNELSALK